MSSAPWPYTVHRGRVEQLDPRAKAIVARMSRALDRYSASVAAHAKVIDELRRELAALEPLTRQGEP